MKLVHKVLLPATIIIALSVGNISHGCDDLKSSKVKNGVNVIKVVKAAVPVDDNQKKDKLGSAKRKARRNLKNSLDEQLKNGEISYNEAEKTLEEFDTNIMENSVDGIRPKVKRITEKELDFRKNFKGELYNQAKNGKISFEKADDIYNSFVDMTI